MGLGSQASRVAGIIAPYVTFMGTYFGYPSLSSAAFGTSAAISCLMVSFLPETKGKNLKATVAEILNDV